MTEINKAPVTESKMQFIDMKTWERAEHFTFFQSMRSSQYGTTVQQDVTALTDYRKKANKGPEKLRLSDILYYFATRAANEIPEFRTRIVDGRPAIFDMVHPAFTYIPKGRNLHANCLARFSKDFSATAANIEIARNTADAKPTLTPEGGEKQNLLYFSIISGVSFTSATNPWGDCNEDSVPRVLFGQITKTDSGKMNLPVSVELLHGLADGRHLAKFFELFDEMCKDPEKYL